MRVEAVYILFPVVLVMLALAGSYFSTLLERRADERHAAQEQSAKDDINQSNFSNVWTSDYMGAESARPPVPDENAETDDAEVVHSDQHKNTPLDELALEDWLKNLSKFVAENRDVDVGGDDPDQTAKAFLKYLPTVGQPGRGYSLLISQISEENSGEREMISKVELQKADREALRETVLSILAAHNGGIKAKGRKRPVLLSLPAPDKKTVG